MNRSLKKIPLAALCAAMAAACAGGATDATITVDASKVEGSVTPWLYGACIEDVNHEIYGGLYDQRIFGESFEEPVPNPLFDDCSAYEGEWQVAGDELLCAAHAGAKLVYDPLEMAAGEVETELKFTRGGCGDNAGLLAGVSEPGNGADNFHGYEISLTADVRKVVLGKHNRRCCRVVRPRTMEQAGIQDRRPHVAGFPERGLRAPCRGRRSRAGQGQGRPAYVEFRGTVP